MEILKEGDADVPINDLIGKHGISRADLLQLACEVWRGARMKVSAAFRIAKNR